jgi:hypothetical protein
MANKKIALRMLAATLVFVSVLAVSCEKADPPEDFDFVTEGNAAYIRGYKGPSLTPRIPSKIRGKKVTRIDEGAFREKGLTSITIPGSVTAIGESAFAKNQLTSVTIGNRVTSIGNEAFYKNQLTSVTIPDSVTSIGEEAFRENGVTSVTIGANVALNGAFDNGFDSFYNKNGRKAGTYTYRNGEWRLQ